MAKKKASKKAVKKVVKKTSKKVEKKAPKKVLPVIAAKVLDLEPKPEKKVEKKALPKVDKKDYPHWLYNKDGVGKIVRSDEDFQALGGGDWRYSVGAFEDDK